MGSGVLTLIGGIVTEGLKTWNAERRLAFQKKYSRILKRIKKAENAAYPHYTDAEIGLAEEDLEVFLQAYLKGKKEHNA